MWQRPLIGTVTRRWPANTCTLKFCRDVWPGVGLRELFFGLNHIAEGCVEYGDCLLFQRVGELKYCDTLVRLLISKCWQRGDREWRLYEEWKAMLPCQHQAAIRTECVRFCVQENVKF